MHLRVAGRASLIALRRLEACVLRGLFNQADLAWNG
jgi:hypothetical protein